jgi:hypothetical protein
MSSRASDSSSRPIRAGSHAERRGDEFGGQLSVNRDVVQAGSVDPLVRGSPTWTAKAPS